MVLEIIERTVHVPQVLDFFGKYSVAVMHNIDTYGLEVVWTMVNRSKNQN
jgi:hypothetical protein